MEKLFNKKSSKLYIKILLYFTISISAVILMVSMVLYFNFERITVQKDYSYIKGTLSQISYSSSFMNDTVKNLLQQVSNDSNLSSLFMDYPPEPEELQPMMTRLTTYVSAIPFIHSIYVYNRSIDRFFGPGFFSSGRDAFFDKEALYILDNFSKYRTFYPIPRVIKNQYLSGTTDTMANIYSFVCYDVQFNRNDNTLDKAIIFNINENWIKDMVRNLDDDQKNDIYIIDGKGTVVMSSSSTPMLTKLNNLEYIQNILKSKDSSGYFIYNINHVKSLVTFVSLKDVDWKFVCITPYSSIISKINHMRNQTILICFILLVFSLVLAYLLSKKVYSPINTILDNFKSLQIENKSGLLLRKQLYLKKAIIFGFTGTPQNLEKDFHVLDVKLNFSNYYGIMLIQIDNFLDFCKRYNFNDRDLFKFAIMNIASELCEKHNLQNEAIDICEDHVVLIINYPFPEKQLDNIKIIVSSIQASILQHLQISISVSISSSTNDLALLNIKYQEALEAANYRLFYGENSIILYTEISQNANVSLTYPIQKEIQLIDSLMLGHIDSVKDTFNEVLLYSKDYSYESFKLSLTRLSTAINIATNTLEKNNAIKIGYDFSIFNQKLEEIEFLEDIRNHFFSLFEYISSKLLERKDTKYEEIISKITDIIEKHYSDPTLSLESISETVGLSPSYVSKIFKQFTSKTVIECITQTRLEVAKKLLSTTDYPINIISEKIGLNYSNYFHKLFKKNYGITPNEYKQKLTLNKDN